MKMGHWVTIVVVLLVGYFVGTKYPGLLSRFTGGMASA